MSCGFVTVCGLRWSTWLKRLYDLVITDSKKLLDTANPTKLVNDWVVVLQAGGYLEAEPAGTGAFFKLELKVRVLRGAAGVRERGGDGHDQHLRHLWRVP